MVKNGIWQYLHRVLSFHQLAFVGNKGVIWTKPWNNGCNSHLLWFTRVGVTDCWCAFKALWLNKGQWIWIVFLKHHKETFLKEKNCVQKFSCKLAVGLFCLNRKCWQLDYILRKPKSFITSKIEPITCTMIVKS